MKWTLSPRFLDVLPLLLGTALAACGGGSPAAPPETPANPESAAAPSGEAAAPASTAVPSPAPASSEPSAPPATASGAAAPASPPAPAAHSGATVDVAVTGKNAGDESVERVVLGVKAGLQGCYERGLANAPNAMGVVKFKINVTASGTIKKVESANPSTMPGSVTNCMVGRFGALSFEPRPATTIEVEVTCNTGK